MCFVRSAGTFNHTPPKIIAPAVVHELTALELPSYNFLQRRRYWLNKLSYSYCKMVDTIPSDYLKIVNTNYDVKSKDLLTFTFCKIS